MAINPRSKIEPKKIIIIEFRIPDLRITGELELVQVEHKSLTCTYLFVCSCCHFLAFSLSLSSVIDF